MIRIFALSLLFAASSGAVHAQLLKTQGQRIVNDRGEEVILRGIGLGGWMLQEGYMLRTGGPQYKIETRIENLVGEQNKEAFYAAWLANHMRKIDVDSLKAWGFNSIRLPMHYKLFTLPIEEEPVSGQNTWLETGFKLTDSLLAWCRANEMYLILDMHATPGGQGENADINDYDPTKPSLWESDLNKQKLVALWRRLAERYQNEPWIGGYDMINEPNWGFQNHANDLNGCAETQNTSLWNLQKDITQAIRSVDRNHMVIIEGNCWGNNYNGLPALWDNNLVISYHKYWNGTDQSTIQGMIDMRTSRNVPIWLGETGENSNSWFTDCIALLEKNKIGWAWWPLKKIGGNNPLEIKSSPGYERVTSYWAGSGAKPTASDAFNALMQFAEATKLENCVYRKDVVDAMIRQPHTDATRPFARHVLNGDQATKINASDYDLGKQGLAYFDADYTNTTGQAGGAIWNAGYAYRNDGVDIQPSSDNSTESNGYNIGWTQNGEWLTYTLDVATEAIYGLTLRYSSQSVGSVRLQLDGVDITNEVTLASTGGYQNWRDLEVQNLSMPVGRHQLKILIVRGGFNLGYFRFFLTDSLSEVNFEAVSAATDAVGDSIFVYLNKSLLVANGSTGFKLKVDGTESELSLGSANGRRLGFAVEQVITNENVLLLSYEGDILEATDGTMLVSFTDLPVVNGLPFFHSVPVQIEAEDFIFNRGLQTESTTDTGGGLNIGYTDSGDYLEFRVAVKASGTYRLEARVASQSNGGRMRFEQKSTEGKLMGTVELDVPVTGGWQTWTTVETTMALQESRGVVRLQVTKAGFNLNWFRFSGGPTGFMEESELLVFPNPTSDFLNLNMALDKYSPQNELIIYDLTGRSMLKLENTSMESFQKVDVSRLATGSYVLHYAASGQSGFFVRFRKE